MASDRTAENILKEFEAKQKADQARIDETFAQFGKCLTTWANVEYALLFVFQEALGRVVHFSKL
jgi:hemerythrin superfamily protein